jgi:hypothetical protein
MSTTSLLPLNPAVSPQQVARILPIRANLLPQEITAGRSARRMRVLVIAAAVIVVVGVGGWYADAFRAEKQAIRDRDTVTGQVNDARHAQNTDDNRQVTAVIQANKAYAAQLKTLMANDLPWSVVLDDLRSTGTAKHVTINSISASVIERQTSSKTALPSSTTASTVANLTISGTAKDKKTIAGFITALATVHGVANPYLTTAAQSTTSMSFTINADVTSAALCGRFSAIKCKTGGN